MIDQRFTFTAWFNYVTGELIRVKHVYIAIAIELDNTSILVSLDRIIELSHVLLLKIELRPFFQFI